jgi:hypothetical protein
MNQSTAQLANQLASQLADQPTTGQPINLPLYVAEPLKVPAKGRPKKPRTARTGRILSGFERKEAGARNKRQRCGAYHQEGHIWSSRECPIKINGKC